MSISSKVDLPRGRFMGALGMVSQWSTLVEGDEQQQESFTVHEDTRFLI